MTIRPDATIYSQVLVLARDFAGAAEEAAEWLRSNEDKVAVLAVSFQLGEREDMPVDGVIRYTAP